VSELGRQEIERVLPHRFPFLFVDRILAVEPGERIVGLVEVTAGGRFVVRDREGRAFLPATVLTEAMAQVGAVLVLLPEENRGRTLFFRAIERVRFRRPVPAGARLRIEGQVKRLRGRVGSLAMKAFLGDTLAASGTMGFALSEDRGGRAG
jgi:3-hydroxyacyl-[acyl-carrier-protein] dehydratase